MKKAFLFFSLLFSFVLFFGQSSDPVWQVNKTPFAFDKVGSVKVLIFPRDTTLTKKDSAFACLATVNGVVYFFDSVGGIKHWQPIGGGTSFTTDNGLTFSSGVLKLGGTLTENTVIAGSGSFNLNFGTSGARINNINLYSSNGTTINTNSALTVDAFNLDVTTTGIYLNASTTFRLLGTALGTGTSDTTNYKPLGINSSGDIKRINSWFGGGGVTGVDFYMGNVHKTGYDTLLFFPSYNPNLILAKGITQGADGHITGTQVVTDSTISWDWALTNITGYISAGTNVSITGSGSLASPYVINATGGGSSYTFANGLTESSGAVALGGGLTGNTSITGTSGYTLNLGTSGDRLGNANIYSSNSAFNINNLLDIDALAIDATADGIYLTANTELKLLGSGIGSGSSDTTNKKPLGIDATGKVFRMNYWFGSGGGGSTSPAGSNTQLQYNASGSFGASAKLTWTNGSGLLSVDNSLLLGNTGSSNVTLTTSNYDLLISSPLAAGTFRLLPFNNDIYFENLIAGDQIFRSNSVQLMKLASNGDATINSLGGSGNVIVTSDNNGLLSKGGIDFGLDIRGGDLLADSNILVTAANQRLTYRKGLVARATATNKRYDAASTIQLRGDTLFKVIQRYGSGSGDGDGCVLLQLRSVNGGETWDSCGLAVPTQSMTPSLFWGGTRDTLKLLFYTTVGGDGTFKVTYSLNPYSSSPTWSLPVTVFSYASAAFSPASNVVKRFSNGKLYEPFAEWKSGPVSGLGYWDGRVLVSSNHGVSWDTMPGHVTGPDNYCDEPFLDEIERNNTAVMNFRTRSGHGYYSRATISGSSWSWSASQKNGLNFPSSQTTYLYSNEMQMWFAIGNPVQKLISGQPEDRNSLDVWVSKDTLGNWQNVWPVAASDSNKHFFEADIFLHRDKALIGWSDYWYSSPDDYHSYYTSVVPIYALLPRRGSNNEVDKIMLADRKHAEQDASLGTAGQSYGFRYYQSEIGPNDAYFWFRRNHNLGTNAFVPEFNIKSFNTDRGVEWNYDLLVSSGGEPFERKTYLANGAAPTSGFILEERIGVSSAVVFKMWANGKIYDKDLDDGTGVAKTVLSTNGVLSLGSSGGSGGTYTFSEGLTESSGAVTWGGSLSAAMLMDANSNYMAFTEVPNIRTSNAGSFTWFFGDMSATTDNKWMALFNENGVAGFRAYSDALSGASYDFLKFDRGAPEMIAGTNFRFAGANLNIQFANTSNGSMGLSWGAYNAQLALSFSTDAVNTGASAGDLNVRLDSHNFNVSTNAGANIYFQVLSTGGIKMSAFSGSGSQLLYVDATGNIGRTSINIGDVETQGAVIAVSDADYSATNPNAYYELANPTTARNFTLPSAAYSVIKKIIVRNANASTNWSFAGTAVKDASNNTVTTIAANSVYILIANGTNWVIVN